MPSSNTTADREKLFLQILSVAAVGLVGYCHWDARRLYLPNQWLGELGMLGPYNFTIHGFAFVLTISAVGGWLMRKRYLGMLLLLTLVPCAVPWQLSTPERRARQELPDYKHALASQARYGDQHEEQVNGRRLVYWRWASWGLDNAIGVIHDPSDKLNTERDLNAFGEIANGVLYKVDRLEPYWYVVVHS